MAELSRRSRLTAAFAAVTVAAAGGTFVLVKADKVPPAVAATDTAPSQTTQVDSTNSTRTVTQQPITRVRVHTRSRAS